MEKQRLLYQQARLHNRGAAEMVLQMISACKGSSTCTSPAPTHPRAPTSPQVHILLADAGCQAEGPWAEPSLDMDCIFLRTRTQAPDPGAQEWLR